MKIVMQDVTVNQVAYKEVEDKKSGDIAIYRNVDIFVPRDVEDEYSKSKAVTAGCADSADGIKAFQYLQSKEGSRVCLLVDYKEAFDYKDKNGNKQHSQERFKILNVIDGASIKPVEMPKTMKVAA